MRKRFFRAATLSIVAGLVIAFLFAVPLMEEAYAGETRQRLTMALSLAEGYRPADGDYAAMARQVGERASGSLRMRFTVLAADGTVLGDSQAETAEMENHAERPEVRDARQTGSGEDVRQSQTTGERQMYRARAVQAADGATLIYRASLPLKGFRQVQVTLWSCAAIGMFMGLIIALLSASYAAGRTVEPLQELTHAARQIAAGESPVRVEEAPDEIGELAGAFNRMSERLAAAHRKLENGNAQLAGILQGMNDGVIAIGADGCITLMTRRAEALLGPCAGTMRRLTEGGAPYPAVQALLDRVMQEGGTATQTLWLKEPEERMLEMYAAPVNGHPGTGALAVISDVTGVRRLEAMRREFAANVTHELKTPLTSIRGYIELLKSGERDEETARSFYEIIEIEAERLQKLTDDLLQLADIENSTAVRETSLVSLKETVERAADTLRPEAAARGITLYLFAGENLRVRAQPHRLYQLIKNLMENAVKYNREGGAVNLSAGEEHGQVVLRVHDTGIGIPPEHLERIFERFYRVDKGRSRAMGGTGLGLSIVKHIAGLYGGDIRVSSEVGTGTTFTVRLPGE